MTLLNVVLENFDGELVKDGQSNDVRLQQAKAAAYAEGFTAGETAATARYQSESDFVAKAVEAIKGDFESVRDEQTAEVCDAFKQLVEKIFPGLAEIGFAEEAAATIRRINSFKFNGTATISVAPARVDLIEKIIADAGGNQMISVKDDDAQSTLALSARWESAGMDFDLEQSMTECLKALEAALANL